MPPAEAQWLAGRVSLVTEDSDYLVDLSAVRKLATVVASELTSRGVPGGLVKADDVVPLLELLIRDQRDETRGLVGNRVAIRVSPLTLSGAVLAAIAAIAWCLSGSGAGSAALAGAGVLHALASAVSALSVDERRTLGVIAAAEHWRSPERPLCRDVVAVGKATMDSTTLMASLALLREKGAVTWDGSDEGVVSIAKWV